MLGLAGLLIWAVLNLDGEALADAIAERASLALELPVELGEVELSLTPLPVLRVSSARIGAAPPEEALLEIEEIRLRVALLPLLAGRVVLAAVDLEAPRVHLEVDDAGSPRLPITTPETPARAAEQPASGPALAVRRLSIRRGALSVGPWQIEDLEVSGRLALDGSADLRLSAQVVGIGSIVDARFELEGLGQPTLGLTASGSLEDLDLAEISERLQLEAELSGQLGGEFAFKQRDGSFDALTLDLSIPQLGARLDALDLSGPVSIAAELGDAWQIDLTQVTLGIGDSLRKPAGEPLLLSGPLKGELSLSALREAVVRSGANELRLELELAEAPLQLTVATPGLDLASFGSWLGPDTPQLSGRVALDRLGVALEPLSLSGSLGLDEVSVALDNGAVVVSGPLEGVGTKLVARELQIVAGGQPAAVSGSYDVESGELSIQASVGSADVHPLVSALLGHSEISGILSGKVDFAGPPEIRGLRGSGDVRIEKGRIAGFSLLEQVLGELSAVPLLVARLKGRDLSRFNEEEFELLSARFRLRDAVVHMDRLRLEYRHASVELRGTIGAIDGALDLAGEVVLHREVDQELSGGTGGKQRTVPIAGVSGTVSRPRVRLDRNVIASLAASYATQGRVQKKLEEKLGPGGAEALEEILKGVFGGRKKGQ